MQTTKFGTYPFDYGQISYKRPAVAFDEAALSDTAKRDAARVYAILKIMPEVGKIAYRTNSVMHTCLERIISNA